jgi:hypothetical protein
MTKESDVAVLYALIEATVCFENYCARDAISIHNLTGLTNFGVGAKAVHVLTCN